MSGWRRFDRLWPVAVSRAGRSLQFDTAPAAALRRSSSDWRSRQPNWVSGPRYTAAIARNLRRASWPDGVSPPQLSWWPLLPISCLDLVTHPVLAHDAAQIQLSILHDQFAQQPGVRHAA